MSPAVRDPLERDRDHEKRIRREELRRAHIGPAKRRGVGLTWSPETYDTIDPPDPYPLPWSTARFDTADVEWTAGEAEVSIVRAGLWSAHVYSEVLAIMPGATNDQYARVTTVLYVNGVEQAQAVSTERPVGGPLPRSTHSETVSPPLVLEASDVVRVDLLVGVGGDGAGTLFNVGGTVLFDLDFMCRLI